MSEQRSNRNTNQQTRTAEEPPPFGMEYEIPQQTNVGSLVAAPKSGETNISVVGDIITAQRVAVERNMPKIMANLKALANAAGSRWYYRIPFKNRKKGTTEYVEGISVKGTNSVARAYGNCIVEPRVIDNGDNWVIYARFVDLETGFSMTRPFQQRKGQETGMGDAERRLDMVFQIGVSKALRNVISNALEDLCSFAFEEAKRGVLDRVAGNPEGAKKWILEELAKLNIDFKRVELVYGRTAAHWTVPDMAKMFGEINGIFDGMSIAADVYPVPEAEPKEKAKASTTNVASASSANATATDPDTGEIMQQNKPARGVDDTARVQQLGAGVAALNPSGGPTLADAVAAVQQGDIDTARDIARSLGAGEQAAVEKAISNRANVGRVMEERQPAASQDKPKNLFADD